AAQVGLEDAVPVLRLQPDKQVILDDAGVVDQDVEPAPLLFRAFGAALGFLDPGHVSLERQGDSFFLSDLGGQAVSGLLAAAINKGHLGPFGGKGLDNGSPDTSTAAGNQRHLILQTHDILPSRGAASGDFVSRPSLPASRRRATTNTASAGDSPGVRPPPAIPGCGRAGCSAPGLIALTPWRCRPPRPCP